MPDVLLHTVERLFKQHHVRTAQGPFELRVFLVEVHRELEARVTENRVPAPPAGDRVTDRGRPSISLT